MSTNTKQLDRRCGTCVYLDVLYDSLGRRVVRKDSGYRCAAPVPVVQLPDSAAIIPGRGIEGLPRKHMLPSNGVQCVSWLPHKKGQFTRVNAGFSRSCPSSIPKKGIKYERVNRTGLVVPLPASELATKAFREYVMAYRPGVLWVLDGYCIA